MVTYHLNSIPDYSTLIAYRFIVVNEKYRRTFTKWVYKKFYNELK